MYYSNGNYEAFAHPKKPEGVDNKSAYLVGAGLASLAAACFLVRDGQMKGENIHILEESKISGGACDGIKDYNKIKQLTMYLQKNSLLQTFGYIGELCLLLKLGIVL